MPPASALEQLTCRGRNRRSGIQARSNAWPIAGAVQRHEARGLPVPAGGAKNAVDGGEVVGVFELTGYPHEIGEVEMSDPDEVMPGSAAIASTAAIPRVFRSVR